VALQNSYGNIQIHGVQKACVSHLMLTQKQYVIDPGSVVTMADTN